MRAAGIIVLSFAWAALIAWWWLDEWTWPLTAACLVAAALVAYVSSSWWPMLVPVGYLVALAGASAIWPTDGAECACEPVGTSVLLMIGMAAVGVIGVCYLVGWSLRQTIDEARIRRDGAVAEGQSNRARARLHQVTGRPGRR